MKQETIKTTPEGALTVADARWVVTPLLIHGWKIVTADGDDVVDEVYDKAIADLITEEHNAVLSARQHGEGWVFEDWQNWYKYRVKP